MRLAYFLVIAAIQGWAADPPSGPSATALPPVYFNHVTMSVDPAVYSAIKSATVLNDLAGFNESTTQRDGGTWSYTAFYIRGQHTYLELMKATNDPVGSIGRAPRRRPCVLHVGRRSLETVSGSR